MMDINSTHFMPVWIPGNETKHLEEEEWITVTIIILFLLLMFGLVAHILAILATRKASQCWKEEDVRPVPTFLVNTLLKIDFCAVVFFLLRGFALPLFSSSVAFRCEFSLSTNIIFTWMSGFANVTMCLERCFALIAPFLYEKHVTVFRAKVILAILILLTFLLACLPIFGFSSYRNVRNGQFVCLSPGDVVDDTVPFFLEYTVLFFFVGFSIVIVICVSNLTVVCFILRLKRRRLGMISQISSEGRQPVEQGTNDTSRRWPLNELHTGVTNVAVSGVGAQESSRRQIKGTQKQNRREMKLAFMFVLVSMVYTISWVPFYLERLLVACHISIAEIVFKLTICLLTLNHVLDPVIFVLLKKRNRQALQLVMSQCLCCSEKHRVDAVRDRIEPLSPNYGDTCRSCTLHPPHMAHGHRTASMTLAARPVFSIHPPSSGVNNAQSSSDLEAFE